MMPDTSLAAIPSALYPDNKKSEAWRLGFLSE
jgi:hypothetical protein